MEENNKDQSGYLVMLNEELNISIYMQCSNTTILL